MPRHELDRSMKLGEFVANCRAQQMPRMTQADLALSASISRDQIASIESGRTKVPPPDTINHLAKALGHSAIEFLERMGYEVNVQETESPYLLDMRLVLRLGKLSPNEQRMLGRIADELTDLRRDV